MLQTGAPAPDFSLALLGGGVFRLRDALAGGPALVGFVKSDCGACQTAFPYLQRLRSTYRDAPWSFLLIAQDRPEWIGRVVERYGLTMPIATEYGEYPVSQAYDPEATPTYFWVEPDGRIGKVSSGFAKKEINGFAALAAARSGREAEDVAPLDDGVAAFKPG
ncbi:MAG TPA: TlpA disulfide reductase family protein [Chloroflexota bacterium]|nr:TlpA disulfide reductase family protein [Chloroflexota bacterium]